MSSLQKRHSADKIAANLPSPENQQIQDSLSIFLL